MDKDTWIVENIAPKNDGSGRRPERRLVKPVEVSMVTRKTKLTLCVLGYWAIFMPPYNLARLSSLTRSAGYHTRVLDLNVETYHDLQKVDPALEDSYRPANYWYWQDRHYFTKIFPTYEPILQGYIDRLLEDDPDIIGFSVYYTNILTTKYVVSEIKKRKPNTTIILGGPECAEGTFQKPNGVDYYFVGESEQNLLDFLDNYENGVLPERDRIGGLFSDVRIDIDSLPYPDYSDFDLEKYWSKRSICAEISRGCVARCTYCSEVWYWKFRDRGATTIVDELEHQVNTYGIEFVNFVDSLMNGNLKEFRNFCEELVKRDLGITWWGYARINGKMDLEFYKLMASAGCKGFNYGIESGSDKVLKAVNKKNTVAEINQNLIDSEKVGMWVNACWVIGAPGEDIEAFTHSFNCLWNHRMRIAAVSPGPGLGDNVGSAYDNRKRFNLNDRDKPWLGGWYTLDFKNTMLHRYIRVKLMHIWLDLCAEFNGRMVNIHSVGDIKRHYDITFHDGDIADEVPYENFDYNMINSDLGDFANTSMNEVFGLLRMIWRVKGGYEINIRFTPELDREDFVFCLYSDTQTYQADINFKIDRDGNYEVRNHYRFVNLDRGLITDKDYDHRYNATGKWSDDQRASYAITKFKKTERHDNGPLPLESAFSSISVSERMFLRDHAKLLPPSSVVVEGYSSLGARATILAHGNSKIQIHSFERFEPGHIRSDLDSMSLWIREQLEDICKHNNTDTGPGHKLLEDVESRLLENPSGRLVWDRITSTRFNNIKLHHINDLSDLREWSTPVDTCLLTIFDEHDLTRAVAFWEPHLKEGGSFIMHPYDAELSLGVYNVVNRMLGSGWVIDGSCDRMVLLKRG